MPVFSFAQSSENIEVELNNAENTAWFNSVFKQDEDSIEYYAAQTQQPQLPDEKKIILEKHNEKVAVFRNHLRAYIAQHSSEDVAAKALIITCFRKMDIDLDSIQSIAETMTGQGLQNKYAVYLFQEIKGRRNNEVGKMFIPFSMTDLNGNIVSSESFKGKNVLVLFWASWCIPCRAEIPDLLNVYHQFQNNNFVVLAVSLDLKKNNCVQAVQHDKTDWINLLDGKAWNTDAARNYAIHFIPQNLLLDASGKIIAKNISAEGLVKLLGK